MSTQPRRKLHRDDLREMGVHLPDAEWLEAANRAIAQRAAPEQAVLRQLADDDAQLWAGLRQQHLQQFVALEEARHALNEAELEAAEAQDRVVVHEERKPRDPKEVARWAAKRSELREVAEAYQSVAEERRATFNQIAARLSGEIWKAVTQRLELTQHGIAEAEARARELRRQGEALVSQAKRKHTAVQRLHSRLVSHGTSVFEEED